MHVIGELQIRHSANRAGVESIFKIIYSVFDLIQLTSILVFAAQLTRAFPNTFSETEFWSPADYSLSLLLEYKTANCTVTVDGSSVTGLGGSTATITPTNAPTIYSLHTERVRAAFAVVACGFVVSAFNRVLFRANTFFIPIGTEGKLRVHKDIVTMLDFALTIGGLVLTANCEPTADLLQQYLKGCSVRSEDSVPFANLAGMYVCSISVLVQHFISICTVLFIGTSFNRKAEPKTDEEKEQEAEEEKQRQEQRDEEKKTKEEAAEERKRRKEERKQRQENGEDVENDNDNDNDNEMSPMSQRRRAANTKKQRGGAGGNKRTQSNRNSGNSKRRPPPPSSIPTRSTNNNVGGGYYNNNNQQSSTAPNNQQENDGNNFTYYPTNANAGGNNNNRRGLASTQALAPASSVSYNNNRW